MIELSILQAIVYAVLFALVGSLIGAGLAILMVAAGREEYKEMLDSDEYAERIRKIK
ncbi:MAG: hypothetical protein LKE48_03365 [Solobacterium sp.]|jgi:hypothetical protein|nr:hypothetical protein [Solobacterium sp.]MCH4281544.1 hypothetical protein [Solobacterium sp.]